MLCTAAINTSNTTRTHNRPLPPNANPAVWILSVRLAIGYCLLHVASSVPGYCPISTPAAAHSVIVGALQLSPSHFFAAWRMHSAVCRGSVDLFRISVFKRQWRHRAKTRQSTSYQGYVVNAADHTTVITGNLMFKYAVDTDIAIPPVKNFNASRSI